AGYGNSPVVSYDGSGAYFLDKLDDGVWRLEVMPDAIVISNPYGRNSLDKTVAKVQWNSRNMGISLPDLGAAFSVAGLNAGNELKVDVENGRFSISPGAYLLTKRGTSTDLTPASTFRNMQLGEFVAPADGIDQVYVMHEPAELVVAGQDLKVNLTAAAPGGIDRIRLMLTGAGRPVIVDLERQQGFEYEGIIPGESLTAGFQGYYILVESGETTWTFPAGQQGQPYEWDFYAREPYPIRVVTKEMPITLFDAQQHREYLMFTRWERKQQLLPLEGNSAAFSITVDELFRQDAENLNGPEIHDFTMKYPFGDRLDGVRDQLAEKSTLVVQGGSGAGQPQRVQIALVGENGTAWGTVITLKPGNREVEIPVSSLRPVKTVILPRPYPTFLPYYFESNQPGQLDLSSIESIQISLGPGLSPKAVEQGHQINLIRISLQ
ncbi:MAG: hypothetical protein KDC75_03105, partial [Phaeodactylibacter sp.]|nr:hypothetical protein [Phaeodactylibacter sp.]